jgi:hypothetical protein
VGEQMPVVVMQQPVQVLHPVQALQSVQVLHSEFREVPRSPPPPQRSSMPPPPLDSPEPGFPTCSVVDCLSPAGCAGLVEVVSFSGHMCRG